MFIEIPLTQNCVAIVDPVDVDLLQFKWFAFSASGGPYAVRNVQCEDKRRTIRMHRVILERQLGRTLLNAEIVDHIDGDSLNNRRANLRIATYAQNNCNRKINKNNASGFKGVSWHRNTGKWRAVIKIGGNQISLGLYSTPEDAHAAYCKAAVKYHGEFARLE